MKIFDPSPCISAADIMRKYALIDPSSSHCPLCEESGLMVRNDLRVSSPRDGQLQAEAEARRT